jgi:hypothetical protein
VLRRVPDRSLIRVFRHAGIRLDSSALIAATASPTVSARRSSVNVNLTPTLLSG